MPIRSRCFLSFGVTLAALFIALILYMRNIPGVITPLFVSVVAAIWGFGLLAGWRSH